MSPAQTERGTKAAGSPERLRACLCRLKVFSQSAAMGALYPVYDTITGQCAG